MSELHLLQRLDLNLLVAFDALARERSVTRAARRVGVSQSAMSHTLRRLRDLLEDPLLVRSGRGMLLTPRAEQLAVPIRSGLVTLERALSQPERFDPATSTRTFRLATPDLFDVLALPTILERLGQQAPGVDLVVLSLQGRRLSEELETGQLDLIVQARPLLDEPGPLVGRTLLRDSHSCFLRADHPILSSGELTLEAYLSLPHALISPTGSGPGLVDTLLAEAGHTRRIALRIPHFYAAATIVADSDLILTAPSTLARLAGSSRLAVLTPPLAIPGHAVAMLWHPRFSADPGLRWLRALLVDVVGG